MLVHRAAKFIKFVTSISLLDLKLSFDTEGRARQQQQIKCFSRLTQ